MRKKTILFLFFAILFCNIAKGQVVYNENDSLIFNTYINEFEDKRDTATDKLIIETAKYFINKPYVASTLEVGDKENLVVNLQEFDCTTFVESCIALSKCIKSEKHSFSDYCDFLTNMRYRNGVIDSYTSRLHYMNDWIYENEKNNTLKDITLELGGKNISKHISYMTNHPLSYKHLKNNSKNVSKLKGIESDINKRNNYNVIPKLNISAIEKGIENGDIIVFATNIKDLDYTHIGIAYRVNGVLKFIHASSSAKKVIIESKSLLNYCQNSKGCSGITVLRIN